MTAGRIGVYGDVDLNVIDGSAVWLASVVEVLARRGDIDITVLLKVELQRDLLTRQLAGLPGVTLVRPGSDLPRRLDVDRAVEILEGIDARNRFDIIVLRGFALCERAARSEQLAGRLWCYLTDIPQRVSDIDEESLRSMTTIAAASDALLCQTEELRSFVEAMVPDFADRTVLLPPMVPVGAPHDHTTPKPNRLVYAGKFAPLWGIQEMVSAFRDVRREFPDLEFHVVGYKIHDPPDDPGYKSTIEHLLRETDGLVWHGAVSRGEVAALVADATLALSARNSGLDDSLELSTKLLEYGQAGVPVALNRTPMHEQLLGASYPYFVDDISQDLEGIIRRTLTDPDQRTAAAAHLRRVSDAFTFDNVAAAIGDRLELAVPSAGRRARGKLLVAGHDLKFFESIAGYLARCGYEVRVDQWDGIDRHDEDASADLLEWADIIVCEWCLGNAVWYSKRKRADQRLVVRLHRVEMESEYPQRVDIAAVDRVVVVGDHFRRMAIEELRWPPDRVVVVGNDIDVTGMDRPKLPGFEFNLAMVGFLPMRKRLDRALDLLARLRVHDSRYRLLLKGKLPWELGWAWRDDGEREYMVAQLERIRRSERLRDSVTFEGFGSDISSFFRKVGFVLSPSDDESFHVGLAEGMAARSLPVIWEWAQGADLYPDEWIHCSTAEAADAVLARARRDSSAERTRAREHVVARYSRRDVCIRWADLLREEGSG